jgi:hypothetical protein
MCKFDSNDQVIDPFPPLLERVGEKPCQTLRFIDTAHNLIGRVLENRCSELVSFGTIARGQAQFIARSIFN